MEKTTEKLNDRRNGFSKLVLNDNIVVTTLDLRHSNITCFDNVFFPSNLTELNLTNNELKCVPSPVLELKNIRILNLSYNNIKFFDDIPAFCHAIEKLNLSNNELCGPPYWVWSEHPRKLEELDISFNKNITKSLTMEYFNELLQYTTCLSSIKMRSCSLRSHYELLETLKNAKTLDLGSDSLATANNFSDIPCKGLDKCCTIERLNLSNANLSLINTNIDIFENLMEINLSDNKISSLPFTFCNLKNLEVCILSFNIIMYLPDDIVKLKKLSSLCLDNNKLCMLPENLHELKYLTKLDVYDNYLYDEPIGLDNIQELDLAQNYFEEPDDEEYCIKKELLRSTVEERIDGRKYVIEYPDSPRSTQSIEEELDNIDYSNSTGGANNENSREEQSSPEDWDSDEYWVPHLVRPTAAPQSPWLFFVKRKMTEGNFCPMDAHTVSVTEKVRYEKLCNPAHTPVTEGQFDDYSSDDS